MTVSKIYRYPIKSMGGEELQSCDLLPNGLVGDRRYAIVDTETGEVACAKVPRKWGALLNFCAEYTSEPVSGQPLPPVQITFPGGEVHRSDTSDIHDLLSTALGRRVHLAAEAPPSASSEALWQFVDGHEATEWTRQRTVGKQSGMDVVRWELAEAVPKIPGEDTFFDLAAVHLITTSTLERFAELSPDVAFDPRRFRPNILLETRAKGFVEQDWIGNTLWCGTASLFAMVPTPRCAMPTLSQLQEDLPSDRRILQTVTRHNSLELEMLGPGKWACAGVYANPLSSGTITVGSAMELRETTPEVVAAMTAQG